MVTRDSFIVPSGPTVKRVGLVLPLLAALGVDEQPLAVGPAAHDPVRLALEPAGRGDEPGECGQLGDEDHRARQLRRA